MHSFEIRQSCQTSGGFLGTAVEALRAFADKIAHGHQQHCDYLQLSAMSEPELQDIGISRSDISAVLSGKYRRVERPPLKANDRIGLGVPAGGSNPNIMRRAFDEIAGNEIGMRKSGRRHSTLSHVQNLFADDPLQRRWEYRWSAASGAWFAVLLSFLLGRLDWRIAVMVAATAFMLARGGDMLDDVGETGEIQ